MTEQIYPEPTCECSAGLDEGQTRCRKCRARDRWIKKQVAKRREGMRRDETRRPPRGPRRIAMAGVTWT
ncbi:unnamed protein product [[Actinomadura] parvosata subsp. kistnae]|uniref:hypothetical protein n=1 Tax=[Actinomadura] parvosata TaxID=1955412 RepID=UPI0009ADC69C|nr:hypothetical protein [Nonomuraea sp. ATCC 55076]SPL93921.1 unnamed protein product [Actinomadura parvosata subsp. kistnae]